MKLIFLISLPRSGSTWIQRELTQWRSIASAPETWFLLPYASAAQPRLSMNHYNSYMYAMARKEISGRVDLTSIERRILTQAGQTFYTELAKGAPILLEKTPRYSLILKQLMDAFPESEFVLLWRNPVDVMESMLRSFGGKYDTLFRYKVDFSMGLENMVSAAASGQANIHNIFYEDLVSGTQTLDALLNSLDLETLSNGKRTPNEIEELLHSETIGDQAYKNKRGGHAQLTHGNRRSMRRMLNKIPKAFWSMHKGRYAFEQLDTQIQALKTHPQPMNTFVSSCARVLYERNLYGLWSKLNKQRDQSLGRVDLSLE